MEIPVNVTPFPIGSRKRKLTSPEMSAQRSAQAAFKSMRVIKSVEEDEENEETGDKSYLLGTCHLIFVVEYRLKILNTFLQALQHLE